MHNEENVVPKIPFYMTYPMQNLYVAEMEYEKDIDRMKTYYPAQTRIIQKQIEERMDELEYEGSRIYDEEPDKWMIQLEIERIYEAVSHLKNTQKDRPKTYFDMVPMELLGPVLPPIMEKECDNDWLKAMVSVLFGMELYKRRCRHRRIKRWW